MSEYDAVTYGDRIADVYDGWYEGLETDAAVDFLAELAGSGPVLELAIGTGRIALPLFERGVKVLGIDASAAMLAKLRAKPGGDKIQVRTGDFADVDIDGKFPLVYVVFNTFFALLSQDDQVRCFQNVASRLKDGGLFVLEAFVPDLARFDRSQRTSVERMEMGRVVLEATLHDRVRQRVDSQHVNVTEGGITFYPLKLRYAWPTELDLMARLAGLRLQNRCGGWRREPFTASSESHVSVYERADP